MSAAPATATAPRPPHAVCVATGHRWAARWREGVLIIWRCQRCGLERKA